MILRIGEIYRNNAGIILVPLQSIQGLSRL